MAQLMKFITTASIVIAMVAGNLVNAQETHTFDESYHEVAVSGLQEKKLTEIEERLDEDIEQLKNKLRSMQQSFRKKVFERSNALDAVLTPDQLANLTKMRQDEAIQRAKANSEFMSRFSKYLKCIADADSLTIYEGLPRADDAGLKKIKDQNKTIEIDGWSFYAEPLTANGSMVEKLRSSLIDYKTFEPYSGGKFCGGFHPDFCVQWNAGGKTYFMQICLGCFEAAYIQPTGKTMFDFNDAAWKSFAQIAISTFARHGDIIKKIDQMIGQ